MACRSAGSKPKYEQNDEENNDRGGFCRRATVGHVLFFPVETGKSGATLSVGVQ